MSEGVLDFPTRSTAPDVAAGRYKIWVSSLDGKPYITTPLGTEGFASVYGADLNYGTENVSDTNNTTTPQEYINVPYTVTDISPSAIYEISCIFVWGYSSGANDFEGKVRVNGVNFGEEFKVEPKDAGADQRIWNEIKVPITGAELASLSGSISFWYQSSSGGNTARMYYSYLKIKRMI